MEDVFDVKEVAEYGFAQKREEYSFMQAKILQNIIKK